MKRFRCAQPGDIDAIVAPMRGYYGQDGYTFVEDEARAAARMLIDDPGLGRLRRRRAADRIAPGGRAPPRDRARALPAPRLRGLDRYLMTKWLSGSRRAPRFK